MLWSRCECEVRFLVRRDPDAWMKLVPGRRPYYCARCHQNQLLSESSLRGLPPQLRSRLDAGDKAARRRRP